MAQGPPGPCWPCRLAWSVCRWLGAPVHLVTVLAHASASDPGQHQHRRPVDSSPPLSPAPHSHPPAPQPPAAQTQGRSRYSSGLGAQSEDLKAKSVSDGLGSFAQLDRTASRASSSSQEGGSAGLTVSLVWKGPCSLGQQHETFVQVRKRLALTRAWPPLQDDSHLLVAQQAGAPPGRARQSRGAAVMAQSP